MQVTRIRYAKRVEDLSEDELRHTYWATLNLLGQARYHLRKSLKFWARVIWDCKQDLQMLDAELTRRGIPDRHWPPD